MRVTSLHSVGHSLVSERGAALPLFVLWLPVLVLFMIFVADVGHWFEHKRHLQMQADAGALAGGPFLMNCPNTAPATTTARRYAGDPGAAGAYNTQVGGSASGTVTVLINSKTFAAGGPPPDDTGDMCGTMTLDVKITEQNVPLFFRIPGLFNRVAAINARARVSAMGISSSSGALPIAAPDVDPSQVTVVFINEATGAEIGRKALVNTGTANGLSIWDNTASPLSVPINTDKVGVRVIMSQAGGSTDCANPFVACYDSGSANGILMIRGYPTGGSAVQPNPPIARDVTLFNGSCADPYFTSVITTCTVGVSANVDFGVNNPNSVKGRVFATINGVQHELNFDNPSKRFVSTGANQFPFFSIPANSGPFPVQLTWAVEGNGSIINGQACTNKNNNPCQGSFGTVQRVFSANTIRSGPVKLAQVWENGNFWANSFAQGTTHDLVVKIGLTPDLKNATSVNDPIVSLRVVGGSQNQSLDCEPPGYQPSNPPGMSKTNLKDELAWGCAPTYTQNPGNPCPATPTELWASPEPWNCVALQTGSATNQVPAGLNQRILGNDKPSSCTAPNHWSQFPNINPGDPRILDVFIVPYGSFSGSGSGTVPVLKFATFYVTGWTASGGGFSNPCQGNGDDPVPNNDAGNIVGHFIKYVSALNQGGSNGQPCDPNGFEPCVAVLTD
jgi:putative Flp pilus-assembly TadE/G-like protein